MQRLLSTFALPKQQLSKLTEAGCSTVEDICDLPPTQFSKEIGVTAEEAVDILRLIRENDTVKRGSRQNTNKQAGRAIFHGVVSPHTSHEVVSLPASHEVIGQVKSDTIVGRAGHARSAWQLLQEAQCMQPIVTFSERLDELLGGGVALGKITEFCGAPGVGKTQISMQLSVDVHIPACFDGVDGEAVYIDTEGSFVIDRLVDIATATVEHCRHVSESTGDEEQLQAIKHFTVESILAGVYYFRCHDYTQLIATVHLLGEFDKQHPKIKLVVVDSIAFHFRHDFDDYSLRTRLLNGLAQSFNRLASSHKLAVVLTNQMTTRVCGGGVSQLIPALGESWGHACTTRVVLSWQQHHRQALLYKSPNRREDTAPYQVTSAGIRDICVEPPTTSDDASGHYESTDQLPNPAKRHRLELEEET